MSTLTVDDYIGSHSPPVLTLALKRSTFKYSHVWYQFEGLYEKFNIINDLKQSVHLQS